MKKIKKEHKFRYDQTGAPDSIWSRSASKRTGTGTKDRKSLDGAQIKQMLGIEDEDHQDIFNKNPLKMMDIVYKNWDLDDDGEGGEEYADENEDEDGEE